MKLPMYLCKIMQQCNSGPYFKTIGVHIDSAVGFIHFVAVFSAILDVKNMQKETEL